MAANVAEIIWYNEDSASPLTVSKPASFASGQILVAVVHQHGATGHVTDITAPTGWTQAGGDLAGTDSQGRVFYHVFNGSEPSTWDFPYYVNADTCLALFRITGADTTPTIGVQSANSASIGATFDSPTITPSAADDLLICTIGDIADGNTFSATAPSGMTATSPTGTQIAGGFMALFGAYQQLSSAGATGGKTWTSISPTGHAGGTFSVVVKSAAAGGGPAFPPNSAGRRRLPALRPRARRGVTPPTTQVVTAPAFISAGIHQPRRLRGLLARRAESFQPVPAQVVLPNPARAQMVTSARRKIAQLRRGESFQPVPVQIVVTPPAFPPRLWRARVQPATTRRRQQSSVPPAQVPVLRGLRRPVRFPRPARGESFQPVPTQIVLTAPSYPPQQLRARLRFLRLTRGRQATLFLPQPVAPSPSRRQAVARLITPRRSHLAVPPPIQAAPLASPRLRPRPLRLTRPAPRMVVPPQVVLLAPPYPPAPSSVRRVLFKARRHRASVDGWMVQGVNACVVVRPFGGVIGRVTGDTLRPFSGVTDRPDCDD